LRRSAIATSYNSISNYCSNFGTKEDSNQTIRSNLIGALEILTDTLYAHEHHFLLEIIQNAEDNHYHDGVAPELLLILDRKNLAVINNERGFSETDVNSLCSVGNSSKKNHKQEGYIGEKGIGFKSYFRFHLLL